MAKLQHLLLVVVYMCTTISAQSNHRLNPTILQDSRDLPQVDGTFGFLYRTEDGIAHGAVGDSSGVIHGRYTYTDPTGLKVNFNYNAGSRRAPGYNYDQQNPPKRPAPIQQAQPVYEEPQQPAYRRPSPKQNPRPIYDEQPTRQQYEELQRPVYDEPRPRPRPQPAFRPEPGFNRPRYTSQRQNNVDYGSYSI